MKQKYMAKYLQLSSVIFLDNHVLTKWDLPGIGDFFSNWNQLMWFTKAIPKVVSYDHVSRWKGEISQFPSTFQVKKILCDSTIGKNFLFLTNKVFKSYNWYHIGEWETVGIPTDIRRQSGTNTITPLKYSWENFRTVNEKMCTD